MIYSINSKITKGSNKLYTVASTFEPVIDETCKVVFSYDTDNNIVSWEVLKQKAENKWVSVTEDALSFTDFEIRDGSKTYKLYPKPAGMYGPVYDGISTSYQPENILLTGTYYLYITANSKTIEGNSCTTSEFRLDVVQPEPGPEPELVFKTKDMADLCGESGDDGFMVLIKPTKTITCSTVSWYSLKTYTHSASDSNPCFIGRIYETNTYSTDADTFTKVMDHDITSKLKYDATTKTSAWSNTTESKSWYGIPDTLEINGVSTAVYKYSAKLNSGSITLEAGKSYLIGNCPSTYNSGDSGLKGRTFIYCDNIEGNYYLARVSRHIGGDVSGQKLIRKTEAFTKYPYILFDDKFITDYL